MELRPYQRRTLDQVYDWFRGNPRGHPIVSACVGAGKSVMIAGLCQEAIAAYPQTRIVMTVASRELCEQNLQKLLTVWPQAPASVASASLGRKDYRGQILYTTVGSVYRDAHVIGRCDLLFIDECHGVNPAGGMYRQLIDGLARYNPMMRVIGWTGTPFRGNGIYLHAMPQAFFSDIAARVTMRELLDQNYLAPLIGANVQTQIDVSEVRKSGGDYRVADLAAASDRQDVVEAACDEIVRLAASRRRWFVYGVTVDHAEHIAAALRSRSVAAAVVSERSTKTERNQVLRDIRSGALRAAVNVGVLTTGIDVPELDCIAMLRSTLSPVLYTQIAGRGMRTAPGKDDCLWLDFTNTTGMQGPVDKVSGRFPAPPKPRVPGEDDAEPYEPPMRTCECGHVMLAALTECPECGATFEREVVTHGSEVSDAEVISGTQIAKRIEISDVTYSFHHKPGGRPTMRVDYWTGIKIAASEFVCFEHTGFARGQAIKWWQERRNSVAPATVSQALSEAQMLRKPRAVFTVRSGRYSNVTRYQW